MSEQTSGVQSVERIFSIIEILSQNPKGMPLQEICKQSGLAKSTAHRLLSSLITLGYVVQDSFSSMYRLTLKMFELSSGIVNDIDIVNVARAHLDRLSFETGEAVHLVVRNSTHVVYVYKAQASNASLRMASHVGLRAPMYCTGVGKAMLATLSSEEVAAIWDKTNVRKLTDNTIVDFETLQGQIENIKTCGYATDDEENELGIRCVAVALPELTGRANAAFSISGLAPQMNDERICKIAALSLAAKKEILKDLGR